MKTLMKKVLSTQLITKDFLEISLRLFLFLLAGHHRLLHVHSKVFRIPLQAEGCDCWCRRWNESECLLGRGHPGIWLHHEEVQAGS